MRKKLIAANWKMHMGLKEAQAYVSEFLSLINADAHKDWVLFVPAIDLPLMQTMLGTNPLSSGGGPGLTASQQPALVKYGAQNCHFEAKGAFTGEISVSMLKELGCQYTLVGHSERRQIFGETDVTCAKKIKALTDANIIPMLCVGETQAERDANKTREVLKKQLHGSLASWSTSQPLTIAYEPVWAIGTGKVATPEMAEEAHIEIRKILTEIAGTSQRAAEIQILYGGSVKPENSRELAAFPNIDGFLVGGASLQAKSFAQIGQLPL